MSRKELKKTRSSALTNGIFASKSPLLNAVKNDDTLAFKKLLSEGVGLHERHHGKTALIIAAEYGALNTMKLLLSDHVKYGLREQNLLHKDRQGLDAFDYASLHEHEGILTLLNQAKLQLREPSESQADSSAFRGQFSTTSDTDEIESQSDGATTNTLPKQDSAENRTTKESSPEEAYARLRDEVLFFETMKDQLEEGNLSALKNAAHAFLESIDNAINERKPDSEASDNFVLTDNAKKLGSEESDSPVLTELLSSRTGTFMATRSEIVTQLGQDTNTQLGSDADTDSDATDKDSSSEVVEWGPRDEPFVSIIKGDIDSLRAFFLPKSQLEKIEVMKKECQGFSPLCLAIREGDGQVAMEMLNDASNLYCIDNEILNLTSSFGNYSYLPIVCAIEKNHLQVVEKLVERGALKAVCLKMLLIRSMRVLKTLQSDLEYYSASLNPNSTGMPEPMRRCFSIVRLLIQEGFPSPVYADRDMRTMADFYQFPYYEEIFELFKRIERDLEPMQRGGTLTLKF